MKTEEIMANNTQNNKNNSRKELSEILLHLADEDDWKTALYILTTYPPPHHVNINKRTTSGDYLIHLSAFACCEHGNDVKSLNNRKYALTCMYYILQYDFTAVNKFASDGGIALHGALAAASCLDYYKLNNNNHQIQMDDESNDNDNDSSDSDSDSDSDSNSDDEYDGHSTCSDSSSVKEINRDLLAQLIQEANESVSIEKSCPTNYQTLSNNGIIFTAIQLLLDYDTDANTPLTNVFGLTYNHEYDNNNNNDDDLELAYTKEAIIQEWTPIMFSIQLLSTVCATMISSLDYCNNNNIHFSSSHQNVSSLLPLAIMIIYSLLKADADPSYMGGNINLSSSNQQSTQTWNTLHLLATECHNLSKIMMNTDILQELKNIYCLSLDGESIDSSTTKDTVSIEWVESIFNKIIGHDIHNKPNPNQNPLTLYSFVQQMIYNVMCKKNNTMTKILEGEDCSSELSVFTSAQSFAISILSNNTSRANRILNKNELSTDEETISQDIENDADARKALLRMWRSMNMIEILPLHLSTTWYNNPSMQHFLSNIYSENPYISLLDMSSSIHAFDSTKLLLMYSEDDCYDGSYCEEILNFVSTSQIRSAIKLLLQRSGDIFSSVNVNRKNEKENVSQKQLEDIDKDMISILLCMNRNNNEQSDNGLLKEKRQQILDRLFLESCTGSCNTYAANILINAGADPNITSIATTVQDGLKPIHLIAGNIRGSEGVQVIDKILEMTEDLRYIPDVIFVPTLNTNTNSLEIALEKRNFKVAHKLWMILQKLNEMNIDCPIQSLLNYEHKILLGEAANECKALDMFLSAINGFQTCNIQDERREQLNVDMIGNAFAKLLICALDERCGFGNDDIKELETIVQTILMKQEELQLKNLSLHAKDEVSGNTPLHLLLRTDRGSELRHLLLRPLCLIMRYTGLEGTSDLSKMVSIPCQKSFGSYTPLHLAYSLGCQKSIYTLIEFEADQHALDSDGRKPFELTSASRNTKS